MLPEGGRLSRWLDRWRGVPVRYDLRAQRRAAAGIHALADELRKLPDEALGARARALRERAATAAPDDLRAEVFALAGEAAARLLGLRPFDEQVLAGLALADGSIVQMQTGEGKTLAAVAPVCLRALAGQGAHVLTFNDYLARRDAEWMGPVYRFFGLSVGHIAAGMPAGERRAAYACDVTYATAKEAGFDVLRDQLATDPADVAHRGFHFAVVDEADSLMIDEARIPLVIAGRAEETRDDARRYAALVAELRAGEHYETDEEGRNAFLTPAGDEAVARALGVADLYAAEHRDDLAAVNLALHARALLRRDVDYLVRGGTVELVDEFTGRVAALRRWPDGLHTALEAKEGLVGDAEGVVLGTMTLQSFLGGYERLAGMTATATAAAEEFQEFYGLETVVIPPHVPCRRQDDADLVFATREAKEAAVADEVARSHAARRPVLVGTSTVAESERIAARLREAGIACRVLNAKHDAEEAAIVALAGSPGAVTIATNMAGRGTDIRLGTASETDRETVIAAGGLYVIGTNRHESRRVDDQLRGRAGRQGDVGESRFFLSLEDDLFTRFGIKDAIPEGAWRPTDGRAVEDPRFGVELARAQRILEGQNLEIRKTLWEYTRLVEGQRQAVRARREAVLYGGEVAADPEALAALAARVGEAEARGAARQVELHLIDRFWADHLAEVAAIREGIHLVGLVGSGLFAMAQRPLVEFHRRVTEVFDSHWDELDARIAAKLAEIEVAADGTIDLLKAGLARPTATWTYLINDNPLGEEVGRFLSGMAKRLFRARR